MALSGKEGPKLLMSINIALIFSFGELFTIFSMDLKTVELKMIS